MNEDKKKSIQAKEQIIEEKAERYYENYRDQMDLLDDSLLAKIKGIDTYDYWALGEQLNSYDAMHAICEEEGSVNQLGKIPTIAYDVITIVYGASVIPLLASVQPELQRAA